MNKQIRQFIGLLSAVVAYYAIHEGAHLLYALSAGACRQIRFLGLGLQIDIHAGMLTNGRLAAFCIAGSAATAIAGYLLVALTGAITKRPGKVFKACLYYITIALLFIDPLYLSALCGLFGGGDMNGIALLVPESLARSVYGLLLACNAALFLKIVLPQYRAAFANR